MGQSFWKVANRVLVLVPSFHVLVRIPLLGHRLLALILLPHGYFNVLDGSRRLERSMLLHGLLRQEVRIAAE